MSNIRNFCIIAHIDHGKSTLADRLLELTGTIEERKMKAQILDQMELERERGITIKLQPVRMEYKYRGKSSKMPLCADNKLQNYILNLIDTPGHVDFSYEVSRSLAAVEGALLVVDATQGVQAQTIANLYLALEQGLEIIPVLNKIDLPAADTERVAKEVMDLIGCKKEDILLVSAKTGEGVEKVLEAIVERIPAPQNSRKSSSSHGRGDLQHKAQSQIQALIFDSRFDDYKGVMAYIRVVSGEVKAGDKVYFIGADAESEIIELGYFIPGVKKADKLGEGEIGYLVTGLKKIEDCKVGDTIINSKFKVQSSKLKLAGYKDISPMVFAGIFCKEGSDYAHLRESLEKLSLTDASLIYEPESSSALGFGFRCGFLGLLHLEIVTERLKREYGLDLIVTVPSVAYKIRIKNQESRIKNKEEFKVIHSSQELPNSGEVEEVLEPWVKADVVTPKEYLGVIMELVQDKRGIHKNTEFLSQDSVILHYELPLSSILVDFYDKLKSASKGYATLNYEISDYRVAEVERLDILVAEEPVEALATIVYKDQAYRSAKRIVDSLKNILPRQMFEVKIQAVLGYQGGKNKTRPKEGQGIGGKIIASSKIPPIRKDVTAKLYGGDVTRKRKLLEKQKKGKKRMKAMGKVDIPQEAYMAVLKR